MARGSVRHRCARNPDRRHRRVNAGPGPRADRDDPRPARPGAGRDFERRRAGDRARPRSSRALFRSPGSRIRRRSDPRPEPCRPASARRLRAGAGRRRTPAGAVCSLRGRGRRTRAGDRAVAGRPRRHRASLRSAAVGARSAHPGRRDFVSPGSRGRGRRAGMDRLHAWRGLLLRAVDRRGRGGHIGPWRRVTRTLRGARRRDRERASLR